jgi:hypothetical protein
MYEFILWACLVTSPDCPVYASVGHHVMIFPEQTKEECEADWKKSLTVPDPEGTKTYHVCQPVEQPL